MSESANPMLSPAITKVTVNIGVGEGEGDSSWPRRSWRC